MEILKEIKFRKYFLPDQTTVMEKKFSNTFEMKILGHFNGLLLCDILLCDPLKV